MAFVNFATREITAKIVYYGPGLGGKTTSLQYIHNNLAPENRGKMISLATEEDRTIYFDFLPLNLGKIQDFAVRVQLYTVPGQVRYNATRKLVLRGADGLIFVADSQRLKKLGNLESFNNMEENLKELAKELKDLPHALQFNKVDLPDVMSSEEMNQTLNKYNVPFFETVATTGIGVLDTLKSITKLVFNDLSKKALLQKKSRVSTSLYTSGGSAVEQPLVSATMTPPPPKPSVTPPPPASYYSGQFGSASEVAHRPDDRKSTFTPAPEVYSELSMDDNESEDPLRSLEPDDLAIEPESTTIEEVEPIDEFDEDEDASAEIDIEPDVVKVEEPTFDLVADDAEELEETPDESYPEVTAEEIEIEKEEEKTEEPEASHFTYGALFEHSGDYQVMMHKLEKQIGEKEFSSALATARDAYNYLITHVYPKHELLENSEPLKLLALETKFKRFLRFKRLLNSEPDAQNLLYIHHFLCDLYLSIKEL